MEKDKLKDHIAENRADFDIYDFDASEVWNGVSESLGDAAPSTVQVPVKYMWRAAAAVLFLIGISAYLLLQNQYLQHETLALNKVSSELAEAHEYYGTLITAKMAQIGVRRNEMEPSIYQDIDALDTAFSELREDLKDNADNEEVINAMIYNYKLKLEILEKILSEIDELNDDEQEREIFN